MITTKGYARMDVKRRLLSICDNYLRIRQNERLKEVIELVVTTKGYARMDV